MDAVESAVASLGTIGGLTSGQEMFQEVQARKFEHEPKQEEKQTEAPAPVVPQHSEELVSIRAQLEESRRHQAEMKAYMERQNRDFQAYLSQSQNQPGRPEQPQLPTYETEDAELAAALNTMDQRIDAKLTQASRTLQQQQQELVRTMGYNRFQQAVSEFANDPDFQQISRTDLERLVAPHLGNLNIDWRHEINSVLKVAKHDRVHAELEAAKRKLAEYEKKQERVRESQKADLKLVPNIGRGGASPGPQKSLGEQILSDYKGKGRMSFKQFGAELMRRRSSR
jgi:hypothetical protein